MRTLLIVLTLVLIAAVGLGFYRGWFSLSSSSDADTTTINLSVDKAQLKADKDKAMDTVTPDAEQEGD